MEWICHVEIGYNDGTVALRILFCIKHNLSTVTYWYFNFYIYVAAYVYVLLENIGALV